MNYTEETDRSLQSQDIQETNAGSILNFVETFAENIRLMIIGPLLVGLVALGVTFALTPTYIAETVILPPQQQQSSAASMLQSLGALGGLAGAAGGLKNPNDQYLAMLRSRSVLDALNERFKLQDRWQADFRQDIRQRLERSTRISSGKDGLISISVEDESPRFAAEIANAYVDELTLLMGRLAMSEAQQRRVFFEQKLKLSQLELIKAEQALRSTGVSPDLLKTKPESAVAGMAELEARISAQEVKLASMRGYLADTAPEFRQAQNELAAMRYQQGKLSKVEVGHSSKSDYVQRFRDFKYHETMVDLFTKQYEIAKIDESREGPLVQTIDTAQPPEKKAKPRKTLITLVSTLISFFLLFLYIFVRKTIESLLNKPEERAQWLRIKQHIVNKA